MQFKIQDKRDILLLLKSHGIHFEVSPSVSDERLLDIRDGLRSAGFEIAQPPGDRVFIVTRPGTKIGEYSDIRNALVEQLREGGFDVETGKGSSYGKADEIPGD